MCTGVRLSSSWYRAAQQLSIKPHTQVHDSFHSLQNTEVQECTRNTAARQLAFGVEVISSEVHLLAWKRGLEIFLKALGFAMVLQPHTDLSLRNHSLCFHSQGRNTEDA